MPSRFLILAAITISVCARIAAPAQTDRFTIIAGRGALTGTEDYTLAGTDGGYRLSGKILLRQMGVPRELAYEVSLDKQWGFLAYRLDASAGGKSQIVEARREGETIRLAATGLPQPKSVPFSARTILLDNLVTGHYQILLDRMTGKPETAGQWSVLVPQALSLIAGKVSIGGIEPARLGTRSVNVRKHTMELGNVLIEFWADTETNRLMRVAVPVQQVEIVREGFALAPAPAQAESRRAEREVTIPSGEISLPATLSLPDSASGRVPVVVLVHGSGPQDRDETIGPNKPFRDIANGLANAGIASLRYDKRTFAFRGKLDAGSITIDEEVVDDAVAALNYARALPEIDSSRVFLLGHSLGAAAAPFVAARFPGLRGAILMAAAVRPLDELIYEQTARAMEIAKTPEADIRKKIEELEAAFQRVRSGEASDTEMVFFAPARYWRDLFSRDLQKAFQEIQAPVLVLQGGKDIQVGKTDYDLLQKALASHPPDQRESHWYPELNHLMMAVEGESTGAEYGRASAVDPRVIEAIASWIKRR